MLNILFAHFVFVLNFLFCSFSLALTLSSPNNQMHIVFYFIRRADSILFLFFVFSIVDVFLLLLLHFCLLLSLFVCECVCGGAFGVLRCAQSSCLDFPYYNLRVYYDYLVRYYYYVTCMWCVCTIIFFFSHSFHFFPGYFFCVCVFV